MVLDESDPNIEEVGDHHAPSTVSAYWVHHPTEGDYLIDAGLSRAFARDGGNYTALLRLLLALFGAEGRSTDGADVASQLRSRGIAPRAVFLTHLHGDHTSGLVDLPALVPAVFGRGEDTFMQKAMIGEHLDGRPLYALNFDEAPALPPFEHVLDLLGDGSIWAAVCISGGTTRGARWAARGFSVVREENAGGFVEGLVDDGEGVLRGLFSRRSRSRPAPRLLSAPSFGSALSTGATARRCRRRR